MGDYDLTGLASRSFEKLIQALAVKILGPGAVIFGDGPDGGREATFDGAMNYPSRAAPWRGYCVLQAKFRQRSEGRSTDGKWALNALEKELKAFVSPKKKRRPPEYYIFATNAILSPVQETGQKDRISSLFRKYSSKIGLRDWRVWDYDQIGSFLDGNERHTPLFRSMDHVR